MNEQTNEQTYYNCFNIIIWRFRVSFIEVEIEEKQIHRRMEWKKNDEETTMYCCGEPFSYWIELNLNWIADLIKNCKHKLCVIREREREKRVKQQMLKIGIYIARTRSTAETM